MIPWMILPGIAPTYVRRCPFNSFTSSMPPTLILKNFLFKARAMDFAIEVFPTPTKSEWLYEKILLDQAALTRRTVETNNFPLHTSIQFTNGNQLQDSILDIFESIMISIQNTNGVINVQIFFRLLCPWKLNQPVQVSF